MMLAVEVPVEMVETVGPVPPPCTADGEMLGRCVVTNLAPFDRTWHNRKTRRALKVTVDATGAATVTTVLGQSRTVTPYDYTPQTDDTPAPF